MVETIYYNPMKHCDWHVLRNMHLSLILNYIWGLCIVILNVYLNQFMLIIPDNNPILMPYVIYPVYVKLTVNVTLLK